MTYPIVLAHGIARFDVFWRHDNDEAFDLLHYWKNIRTILRAAGYDVHHTNVDWAGPVAVRAGQLAAQILRILDGLPPDRRKVNILAHSMGGLDARYAIARCGLGPHVASLTTLATPHHGTAFADWGMSTGLTPAVSHLLRGLGIDLRGFADLTRDACAARNRLLQDFEEQNEHNILYQAYAGVQDRDDIYWLLNLPYQIIHEAEGPNDGLVPESSARWKDSVYRATLELDHLNFLGWWDWKELDFLGRGRTLPEFDAYIRKLYLGLAATLP
jgi:triacylglycerol lipase